MLNSDELARKCKNEIEDYQQTVRAPLAFAAFVVHDGRAQRPYSNFGFGRRMTKLSHHCEQGTSDVTPDIIAQKCPDYGVVGEVKKTLCRDQTHWRVHLEQLRKYDDDLLGWWTETERTVNADVAMLIHQSRGRVFSRYLNESKAQDQNCIGQHTCLIEFNQSEEGQIYYFFRIAEGHVRDEDLFRRLDLGVSVPFEKVLMSFPQVQYYDAKPPILMMVNALWTDVFPSLQEEGERDDELKCVKLRVSATEITREIQSAYGSGSLSRDARSAEFPRITWIEEALQWLVLNRMAIPPEEGTDIYTILYRQFRKDVVARLVEMHVGRMKTRKEVEEQLTLFPDT